MYLDAIKYPKQDHRIFADSHSSHLAPGDMVLCHSEAPAVLVSDHKQNGAPFVFCP